MYTCESESSNYKLFYGCEQYWLLSGVAYQARLR